MTRSSARTVLAVLIASWVLAGCDKPPEPPRTADRKKVEVVSIAPGNADELETVVAFEKARVNYGYRLDVLAGYYERIGDMDKLRWARREQENLANVQAFRWDGVEVLPPAGESVEGAEESLLVEQVVSARRNYLDRMEAMESYYASAGDSFKQALAQNMRQRFDPVRTYRYFMSAEIPPADLKPTEVIPEADALFDRAVATHRKGKPLPGVTDYDLQRKALMQFLLLVREYPRSTKIALAAYYIGDIYKEYFHENLRAVHWYERAWQWDPAVTKPARFQAAVVWDIRLKNYANALELYRASLQFDPPNWSNRVFAERRIDEMTRPEKE